MHEPRRDPSSEELARGAQAGSSACFAELVRRHERALFNFLRVRTRSDQDAEELAQDAFVRAWHKIASYRSEWKFTTWLFALARSVAASRLRALDRRSASHADLDGFGVECDPASRLDAEDERVWIWDLAARVLSADQRSALWLRYVEDLPVEEIGRVLGRRPAAVRALLFRARGSLAPHLEGARQFDNDGHLDEARDPGDLASTPARASARSIVHLPALTQPSTTP